MSWWPETSARVAGRYFSTLTARASVTALEPHSELGSSMGSHSPWQAVLGFDGQVGGASFAFGCVVRREGDVLRRWRDVNVHLVFEVRHFGRVGDCSPRVTNKKMLLGRARGRDCLVRSLVTSKVGGVSELDASRHVGPQKSLPEADRPLVLVLRGRARKHRPAFFFN